MLKSYWKKRSCLVQSDKLQMTLRMRRRCMFTHHCLACEKVVPGMVFHLNLKAGQSILWNLKTIPFLWKAVKTCIQLFKEFPDPKAKYGVRYSYYQSGWRGLENNVQDETEVCSERAEKNDLISLSLWKNGRGLLFWNHISLKNTQKTKQNWQCRINCLLLFCLLRPLFAPLP